MRYGRYRRSYSSTSQYGVATLCSTCAARYTRVVKWREQGLTLANRGFLAMIGCVVLWVFAYNVSAGKGPASYVVLALIGLSVIAMVAGCVIFLAARLQHGSATRFLRKPASPASA